jgi:hypothetical protein
LYLFFSLLRTFNSAAANSSGVAKDRKEGFSPSIISYCLFSFQNFQPRLSLALITLLADSSEKPAFSVNAFLASSTLPSFKNCLTSFKISFLILKGCSGSLLFFTYTESGSS